MSTKYLAVSQNQRIDVLGVLNVETTDVWLSLHGYGQLVTFFQRHFRPLVTESRALIFPQGQHKFYLQGTEGRVGASWMTKEDRLEDIANQRLYLNTVCDWAKDQAPNARFHMLGFSQGVATGMRFSGYSNVRFYSFLAWAGSWPPDLEDKSIATISNLLMSAWFGTKDPYIGEQKKKARLALYNNDFRLFPEVGTYEGAHSVDSDILAREIIRLEQATLNQ